MNSRRNFFKKAAVFSAGMGSFAISCNDKEAQDKLVRKPIVLSTWRFGVEANAESWKILEQGGRALDAVEQGVRLVEADPEERSVGYGGRPDREGRVTLDACIMDEYSNIGAVGCMEHIIHPISVARAIMEKTPHVMLVGQGALDFALSEGFKKENLLTEVSKKEWQEWLKESKYLPIANIENHDTIGMIAMDESGNLSGACSTSGMAYKMHGRLGDSPIIGAGLYVDNEVGAAVATGHGEEVIRVVGSHLVVEQMRAGKTAQEACEAAVRLIHRKITNRGAPVENYQIGFLALDKKGGFGAFALQKGFNFAVQYSQFSELIDAGSLI
jgi:N4-(beta-N-acetylglucosaminyl)-L-asparaginase